MSYSDGNILFDNDLNSIVDGIRDYGVISGLAVSVSAGMQLSIATGRAFVNGTHVNKTSTSTVTLDAANSTNPRKDIIIMNSAGTITSVTGTPATAVPSTQTDTNTYQPAATNISSNQIILAEVWVPAAALAIVSGNIIDKRVFISRTFSKSCTLFVAASNASEKEKAASDYICDGTLDNVEIQAAIDALAAANGGTVELSEGTFTGLGVEIESNIHIKGQGWGTILKLKAIPLNEIDNSDTEGRRAATLIYNYEVDGMKTNWKVSNLQIDGNKANQTVASSDLMRFYFLGIFVKASTNVTIENVYIHDCVAAGLYIEWNNLTSAYTDRVIVDKALITDCGKNNVREDNGVHIELARRVMLSHIICKDNIGGNFLIQGNYTNPTTTYSEDIILSDCFSIQCVAGTLTPSPKGFSWGYIEKLSFNNCYSISDIDDGFFSVNSAAAGNNYNLNFNNCIAYDSGGYGFFSNKDFDVAWNNVQAIECTDGGWVNSSSNPGGDHSITNFVAKDCTGEGLYISQPRTTIIAPQITNCDTRGIMVETGGDNCSIIGGIVRNTSGPGIRLLNVGGCKVIGVTCTDDQTPKTQTYGIVEDGTSDNNIISENDFRGNLTAALSSSGASTKIRNNFGWVTENSGIATITNGTTAVTVTHGLSAAPTLDDITVSFGENPTNDPGNWWISTVTATQFNINVRNDPGATNLDVAWKVIKL